MRGAGQAGGRHLLRTRSDVGQGPAHPRDTATSPRLCPASHRLLEQGKGRGSKGCRAGRGCTDTGGAGQLSGGISSSAPGSLRAAARGAGTRGVCCSLSSDVSLRCPNLGVEGSCEHTPLFLPSRVSNTVLPAQPPPSPPPWGSAGSPELCPLRLSPTQPLPAPRAGSPSLALSGCLPQAAPNETFGSTGSLLWRDGA